MPDIMPFHGIGWLATGEVEVVSQQTPDGKLVDGTGWISEESDFYGSSRVKAKLEARVKTGKKRGLEDAFAAENAKRVKTGFRKTQRAYGNKQIPVYSSTLDSGPKLEPAANVLDFLKSRPQVAAMQKSHVNATQISGLEIPRTTAEDSDATELVKRAIGRDRLDTRQVHESVLDFLRRAPIADMSTADLGPWLWIHSPTIPKKHLEFRKNQDVDTLKERGWQLLEAFSAKKAEIESDNPDRAQATITKKMSPYREQLEDQILSLAVKTGTTSGKWMLFPGQDDLPRFWRVVAEAVSEGKLGPTAKVATPDAFSGRKETLICIYTYDFSDEADVRRVLDEILDLELCRRDGKPIWYKCDAYTHLGIESANTYKIRASLYGSTELLNGKAKSKSEGPVERLKKRKMWEHDSLST